MNDNRLVLRITPAIKYFILLFPVFKPDTITSINRLHFVSVTMTIMKYAFFFILLFWFSAGRRKMGVGSLAFPLLITLLFASTVMNGNLSGTVHLLSTNVDILYYYLIFCYMEEKGEYLELLSAAYFLLLLWCLGNTISVFAFYKRRYMYIPSSGTSIVKDRYLLGSKNYQISFILPLLGISFIHDQEKYRAIRFKTILVHILSIIPLFMTSAATSVIAVTVFYVIVLWAQNDPGVIDRLKISYVMISSNIVIFLAFVVMGAKGAISHILERIFKKSIKSQRSVIWGAYLEKIREKMLIGYGYMSDIAQKKMTGIVHAHNQYLQMLFSGGIVGLCIFFIFLASLLRRSASIKNKEGVIAFAVSSAMIIAFEGDYYYSMTFYFIVVLVIVHNYDLIDHATRIRRGLVD